MNNKINDGGPAFPHLETTSRGEPYHDHLGMTLRDYFAAAIMQGLMASQCEVGAPYPIYAYAIADSMLKVREVKP